MTKSLLPISALLCLSVAATARADVPSVAVDIAPVHSLVARVMEGVGTPDLVIPAGASPHGYSLRPSEARALQEADLVVWVGEALTPWMEDPLATLAGDAAVIELAAAEGTTRLEIRDGALFEDHDHDGEHGHEGDHDAAHDDHDHDEDHAADEDHHDHAHEGADPHVWLDPGNASVLLGLVADRLAALDPENAAIYRANEAAAQNDLADLTDEIAAMLAPVRGRDFIVFHDAYQYFETAFDMPAAGAIAFSDAAAPSPARIEAIRDRVAELDVTCVLSEPQYNPDLVATVLDGTGAGTGVMDPLGASIETGGEHYFTLMRSMAQTLADCL